MPATTVHRSSANAKPANQELAELQQKIATLKETNKQLLRNPNSVNKAVADNNINSSHSLNDLTKSPDLLGNKTIEANISEKKQIKAEVVTLKKSTAELINPVRVLKVTPMYTPRKYTPKVDNTQSWSIIPEDKIPGTCTCTKQQKSSSRKSRSSL